VKTAFSPVDGREILERLNTVPILSWRYRTEDLAARHIGPTAQDFHQAFQVGVDERYISSVDADGIAMAAIQSLYDAVKERDRAIEAHEKRIRELEEEMAAQKRLMAEFETRLQGIRSSKD
jgi:pyruvate carboxylase